MEKKEILQKLNNQYFKSLKRFEKSFSCRSDFEDEINDFNNDYLKIISAVLNNDTYGLNLNTNFIYICATINEKNGIRILIDSIPTND